MTRAGRDKRVRILQPLSDPGSYSRMVGTRTEAVRLAATTEDRTTMMATQGKIRVKSIGKLLNT